MCAAPSLSSRHMLHCRHTLQDLRRSFSSGYLPQRLADLRGSARQRQYRPCSALLSTGSSRRSTRSGATTGGGRELLLRRALLGSFFFTLGAMPFSMSRRAKASAAELTAGNVLAEPNWPDDWPFSPRDFQRFDESVDTAFYDSPRFVTHIDDGAIGALTKFYERTFPPSGKEDVAVLDVCSSWISHYPKGFTAGRIAGLGMNAEELKRNPVLTDWSVKDLNQDPKLPYEDNSFDVITNAVSVDYLAKPLEVFREMHRVLKPGGRAIMSFSNRCFPTKAIAIWTSTGDVDHVWIVGSYYHYSVPGGWSEPVGEDISPNVALNFFGAKGDPMYVVHAQKLES